MRAQKDLDLGHGFSCRTFTESGVEGTAGLIITGPAGPNCPYQGNQERLLCGGGINFENSEIAKREKRPRWKLISEEPLTVTPSLQCKCKFQHGHITNGRYVPC